jgi:Ca-activated chloride channel family protein
MKTTTRFDYSALPANSSITSRILISLDGKGLTYVDHKTPLDISMVIDNSGSMQGPKIAKVKEAATMIARMLEPHDIFSLVTFNDTVNTVVPAAKGADLAGVETLISRITAGGSTNLCGGYERGFELASEGRRIAKARVVILSDGQANVGTISHDDLSCIAGKFRDQQVTTTTFGVGEDFDERILAVMAESGGGSANFIEHPWHAAEVFRSELEDLRNITATNTRARFVPGAKVVSCTLLNNFPVNYDGDWLIGDVYGNRERQIVLEVEVKTSGECYDFNLGTFELQYDIPGKDTTVPVSIPVPIPVVSKDEFAALTADEEVILEAALLTIGRAKRNAMNLACEQKFIEAADLLDSYIAALSGLRLNDPELDSELEKLRERSWNLRHRGKEFFTATEQKYLYYEADMTLKGKKAMYNAMMSRKEPTRSVSSSNSISIFSQLNNRELMVEFHPDRTVSDFLKEVFVKLDGAVKPRTYGLTWGLRDAATSRIFDIGTSYARVIGKREDVRSLKDIGIDTGLKLEVVALPALPTPKRLSDLASQETTKKYFSGTGLSSDVICIDMPQTGKPGNRLKVYPYRGTMIACDFLADLYNEIQNIVPPNSYGRQWFLRDAATGRVFDFGSAWARFHRLQADVRPIDKIGIIGGMTLQAVVLSY